MGLYIHHSTKRNRMKREKDERHAQEESTDKTEPGKNTENTQTIKKIIEQKTKEAGRHRTRKGMRK